jgi:hypothetical protein
MGSTIVIPKIRPASTTTRRLRGEARRRLALVLSDAELRQQWVENAAVALTAMILNNRDQGLDGGAVYHATHGLEIYRNRIFGPTPHPPRIPLPPRRIGAHEVIKRDRHRFCCVAT